MSFQDSIELQDSMDMWLAAHAPGNISLRNFAPVALLATAVMSGTAANATISGRNAPSDSALSDQLAAQAKTDPDAARATFAQRPLDGCTSIMNISRVAAGFEPSKGMSGDNVEAYARYIASVQRCPLFNLDMNDIQTISRSSDDSNELISSIANLFDGIEAEDKDKVRNSIQNLVQAASSNSSTVQSSDLFVQSVINSSNGVYQIFIYSSHVQLVDHKSKHDESIQADYKVSRTKMTFRVADWPAFAGMVWDKQYSSVTDWLNDNTTPLGGKTVLKTCL